MSLNLHGIVRGTINAVNADIPVTLKMSTGYTNVGGRQTPTYRAPIVGIPAQFQALTFKDLTQLDGLNLNGVQRAVYFYGKVDAVIRSQISGGDIIIVAAGVHRGEWLVNKSLEQWPHWCKIACTLQNPVS